MNYFDPAVAAWFSKTFSGPTEPQQQAWPLIQARQHTLIAAPTGSGKTLASFLAVIDALVRKPSLDNQTYIIYVSPLKALSNDIDKNLQQPLHGITECLYASGRTATQIQSGVRTGDTSSAERRQMHKQPPHILVTTPESLFILLSSESGRSMLKTAETVIIDEIHALAGNKRGAHLSLSLERLQTLTAKPLLRIGLSATQKPLPEIAAFLMGNRPNTCHIIDNGYQRERDLAIETPGAPLEPVMSNEVWQEIYARLTELIQEHHTTLIFVNTRRLAERAARFLAERLGPECVAAHHGSLAREHRLEAEEKLKRGELKVMVATASLELGIDIGDIDLVCQLGSPRTIAAFLQRVGRSGHAVGGLPKGRLFPLSRDELVECAALLDAVERGELDRIHIPSAPLDVLAQHIVAEVANREWPEAALREWIRLAYPYRNLGNKELETLITMLAEGYTTHRGRRSAYLHHDAVNHILKGRKGARLTAITNAGTIPDQFDYDVILEPQGIFIGTLNEDFAFESLPGDIFQLGNTSYRILKTEQGKVRVEDARGQPPNIPFWFGEAPGRSHELSLAVSRLREEIQNRLDQTSIEAVITWLVTEKHLPGPAAVQLTEYLAASKAALGHLPTQHHIILERFFDEAGDQHLVIHSPFGSRLNRAWGLALRKTFCRKFNFELQAAALEDTIILSLGATHSFPLDEVQHYLKATTVRDILTQAVLDVPLFLTHWRWNACIALAIKRRRSGKKVPAQFQRMDAEDLMAVIFPDQLACQENLNGRREIPDHPLVQQTLHDCLHEVMDITALETLLHALEAHRITFTCLDLAGPSPLAHEILNARPYAFLDDAPAEERRTQAVIARRFTDPHDAAELGRLNPEAIQRVKAEAWPAISHADEYHDALLTLGFITHHEAQPYQAYFTELAHQHRACRLQIDGLDLQVAAERLSLLRALWPNAGCSPNIQAVGAHKTWTPEESLREILRARLQGLGPVTELSLADTLRLPLTTLQTALYALENEGYAMRGHYSPQAVDQKSVEWCERGLLARIHRYTLKQLRSEIQPVNSAEYMRFLLRWHHLDEPLENSDASLLAIITQLEGFPVAAAAWETDILPARLKNYLPSHLDALCLSGHISWIRAPFKINAKTTKTGPLRNTPVIMTARNHLTYWQMPNDARENGPLSHHAQTIRALLQTRGALFFMDLVQASGLLRTQVELALGELVCHGLLTADAFAGLRALITPPHKRPGFRNARSRHVQINAIDQAGRWSLLISPPLSQPEKNNWLQTPVATLEHIATRLLHRYGVVFRKILEREHQSPPWRELLYIYRRMEARGDIRGGRFVASVSGEQFALPDAVGLLRQSRSDNNDQLIAISAVDPVNLTGIITAGQRIPAMRKNRILYRNGIPAAVLCNGNIELLEKPQPGMEHTIRNTLIQTHNPFAYPKHHRKFN